GSPVSPSLTLRCHLPNSAVTYPRGLSASAIVTSLEGSTLPRCVQASWIVYLPVSSEPRLGVQTGDAVYHRLKTVPSCASRSRFGVCQSFRPLNGTSPKPRSSA